MSRIRTLFERYTPWAVYAAIGVGTFAIYIPNAFALKYIRKTFAAFNNGEEVAVSSDVMNLTQEVGKY